MCVPVLRAYCNILDLQYNFTVSLKHPCISLFCLGFMGLRASAVSKKETAHYTACKKETPHA